MSRCRLVSIVLAALAASAAAQAQYKVVGPDGRVTYTDRPPPADAAKVQPIRTPQASPAGAALPYALREVAARYPVTLYASADCPGCDAGRTLLKQRGIPYSEKTVASDADLAAFARAEASGELPLLRIGSQQLRGYSASEWTAYLDAAGYPKESRLPASYRGWDPVPLAGTAVPAPASAPAAAAPVSPPQPREETPPSPPPPAPGGFRF